MTPVLLVPLDGSDSAESALPVAIALARRLGASLRLVGVHVAPASAHVDRAALLGVGEAARLQRQALRDRLAAAAARVRDAGVAVHDVLADGVDPARELVARAGIGDVRLVVMTTHARGALERAFLGSVADRVMREAPVPVVVVPPAHDAAVEWAPRRVVVALDGSDAAREVLPLLVDLGLAGDDVDLVLVQAIETRTLLAVEAGAAIRDEAALDAECDAARAALAGVVAALPGGRTTVQVLPGRPADVVLQVAADVRASLVAMTTRGHGGLRRLALGSTADAIVRRTALPVLVVAPRALG